MTFSAIFLPWYFYTTSFPAVYKPPALLRFLSSSSEDRKTIHPSPFQKQNCSRACKELSQIDVKVLRTQAKLKRAPLFDSGKVPRDCKLLSSVHNRTLHYKKQLPTTTIAKYFYSRLTCLKLSELSRTCSPWGQPLQQIDFFLFYYRIPTMTFWSLERIRENMHEKD